MAYSWSSTLVGNGTGTAAGGWTQVTTMANGRTATEQADLFGRTVWKSDLGGHITYYVFDAAGRQISNSMGGLTASFTYYNTGQIATNSGPSGTATYGYDATGNRLSESLVNTVAIKSASATYDAMGRLKTWTEAGTTNAPAASTTHEYDANGNIRRTQSSFAYLDGTGNASPSPSSRDSWYRYDSMNRLVTDKGQLSGAAGAAGTIIVRGYNNKNATSSGRDIVYDVAGQRVAVLTSAYEPGHWQFIHDPHTLPSPDDPGQYVYHPGAFQELRENYTYDGAGRLTEVRNAYGTQIAENYTPEGGGDGMPSAPVPGAPATGGYLRGSFTYDLMGRLTLQQDYGSAGGGPGMFSGAIYSRSIGYNAKGQVTSDDVSTAKGRYGTLGWDIFRSVTTYDYGWGGNYALGSVVSQSATNSKFASGGSWSSQPGTTTTTAYTWYDGAVQDLVTHDYDTGSGSNPLYTTDLLLNGFGQMTGAVVADGVAKSVAYTLDETGQIVRRDEIRTGNPSQAAPHEVYYRFGGRQMGMTGNNGTADLGYVQSTESRSAARPDPTTSTAGLFRGGMNISPGSYADFATSYDPYSSDYQGSAGGMVTVRQGDTLQSIAANLWGDANLWYKLAEANGIGASNALIEGQTLVLPTGVSRSGHSASSIRPYDPTDAIGDLSPTTPKPPKKPKCGMLGMIVSAVFAAAATYFLGPILGNVASQGFNNLIGTQKGFSWKSLGLSVASAAVTMGVGSALGTGAMAGSQFVGDVVRGAATSALTQGVGMATGLQSRFDFAGVAAAGIGNGVNGAVSGTVGGSFGGTMLASTAGGIANAATRSAWNGNSFGDNLRAAIPDIIAQTFLSTMHSGFGQTIGSAAALAGAIGGSASVPSTEGKVQTTGDIYTNEIVVGNYDLSGLMVSAGPASLSGVTVIGTGDDGQYDGPPIVVEADRHMKALLSPAQMSYAGFLKYEQATRGTNSHYWAHQFQDRTSSVSSHGYVSTVSDGVEYWGGPKLGVLESGRQIVTAFGTGIWDAAKGLGTMVLTGLAAQSNIPGVSNIARAQIRDVGRRIGNGEIPRAAFGSAVSIFDQAVVHDNILPGVEAGGGAVFGLGIGKLSSLTIATRTGVAAERAAPEFITVFRGDRAGTTVIKSAAAREGGYASSQRLIDSNNLDDLFRSHALDSASPPSPFISVTTDPAVARYFAGPTGVINEFRIPLSRATNNPFNSYVVPAGPGGRLIPEAELLVPNYIRPSEFVRKR